MIDIRNGTCPLCDHQEIIEAIANDLTGGGSVAAAVTYDHGWLLLEPHGRLKMYVCRSCGYCQTFANEPKTIPISDAHQTRLIKGPDKGTPFR